MQPNTERIKKRINIELPQIIIEKLDALAGRMESTRSELIRGLLAEKLAEKEKEEFDLAMKKGYLANYAFIKESNEEWDVTLEDGL